MHFPRVFPLTGIIDAVGLIPHDHMTACVKQGNCHLAITPQHRENGNMASNIRSRDGAGTGQGRSLAKLQFETAFEVL